MLDSQQIDKIKRLYVEGATYKQIIADIHCSPATISKLVEGLPKVNRKQKYNWAIIQNYYDEGHTVRECARKFGFNKASWSKAVRRGDVKPKPKRIPLSEFLLRGRRCQGTWLKERLIEEGILQNKCFECGQGPIWNSKPLVLQLDHINGDVSDNRLENLRILCPHCHSQTDTFGSRNKFWKLSYNKEISRRHKPRPSEQKDVKLIK